jgi:hypothetical protein
MPQFVRFRAMPFAATARPLCRVDGSFFASAVLCFARNTGRKNAFPAFFDAASSLPRRNAAR